MSLRCNEAARNAQLVACLLGAVLMHCAEAAPVLNVCVDRPNPTSAMDARVARAVAKTQGYVVQLVPFVGYGKGGDGLPLSRFAKMAQSECQLAMGFPVDTSDPKLPPNVEATSAYASTGFVLVSRGSSNTGSLSELPTGQRSGDRAPRYLCRTPLQHPSQHRDACLPQGFADAGGSAGEAHRGRIGLAAVDRTLRQQAPYARIAECSHPARQAYALEPGGAVCAASRGVLPSSSTEGLDALQSTGHLERLIKPYQHAAAAAADRMSARWPVARLQYAVAWNANTGRLLKVADTSRTRQTQAQQSARPVHRGSSY